MRSTMFPNHTISILLWEQWFGRELYDGRKAGARRPNPTAAPSPLCARRPKEVKYLLISSSARGGTRGHVRIALSTMSVERPPCTVVTININRKKRHRRLSLRILLCAHEAVIAHCWGGGQAHSHPQFIHLAPQILAERSQGINPDTN